MKTFKLEAVALFQGLDPDEIDLVRRIFDHVSFGPHQSVINEGEKGREMFVLVSGKVRVVKSMLRQDIDLPGLSGLDARKVLAILASDCFPVFGEMALIDADIRSATVETLEPCQFLRTDRQKFFDLVKTNPILGCKLLRALCKRMAIMVRSSNQEVVKLTTALALLLSGKH